MYEDLELRTRGSSTLDSWHSHDCHQEFLQSNSKGHYGKEVLQDVSPKGASMTIICSLLIGQASYLIPGVAPGNCLGNNTDFGLLWFQTCLWADSYSSLVLPDAGLTDPDLCLLKLALAIPLTPAQQLLSLTCGIEHHVLCACGIRPGLAKNGSRLSQTCTHIWKTESNKEHRFLKTVF